jgi:hypothetical protein
MANYLIAIGKDVGQTLNVAEDMAGVRRKIESLG